MRKKIKQLTLPIRCYSTILLFTILERRRLALEVQITCMHALVCIISIQVCGCLFFFYLWSFFLLQLSARGKKKKKRWVVTHFHFISLKNNLSIKKSVVRLSLEKEAIIVLSASILSVWRWSWHRLPRQLCSSHMFGGNWSACSRLLFLRRDLGRELEGL